MLSLISNILDLSRANSNLLIMESIPFQLTTLLQRLEHLLIEQARSKQLLLTLDNHFHLVKKQPMGDLTRLQQVLLNLLSNAIKFTPKGEISLNITPQQVADHSVSLRFEVQDNGIGISTQQQKKLFRPFSQADSSTTRQYGGSGLGLAISQKLVQRMGGELGIRSKQGKGSCFFFTLTFPLQAVKSKKEVIPIVTVTPTTTTSLIECRILLVDDDEMNRFFGRKIFKAIGVQVETADSGEDAIHCLQKQLFDVVFMDISMPGIDGYETTRRIRADEQFNNLCIIALTAHAIKGERARCLAAGMNDYLTKPFEIEKLENMIRQWATH
jgi:CheY-like chemotaxis protein/two-component sensor histidine kinase